MVRDRRLHVEQVRGHRFVAGRGPKRSATVVPAPLRYWQYRPAGPIATAATVLVVAVWLILFAVLGGADELRGEIPLALAAGLAVFVLSTVRLTVSDHGLSFDVAGTRPAPDRVIPLVGVRELRTGAPPADWPAAKRRGGWWPGRTRVALRYANVDGDRALSLWVRDPEAFAAALRTPLQR
ncbi:hypothetical protein A6V29_12950 [Blastococcus sp. CCUG 61487]|nr:hypothetical protein A6V29_12950 [Blastococcus sp. CCUG 61487]